MLPKDPIKQKEYRQKLSSSMKGNKSAFGAKRSPEFKEKIRQRMTGSVMAMHVRKKISVSRTGKLTGAANHAWKGGVSDENHNARRSFEYNIWRESVFKRDKYTCIWCGDHNYEGRGKHVVLHADHIKPWCDYPELRLAIDNGRTLCKSCHEKTDTWGYRACNLRKQNGN